MAGSKAPASGSRKHKKNDKNSQSSSGTRLAAYATAGVALATIVSSALGASRWWFRSGGAEGQAFAADFERIKLLGEKVELLEKAQQAQADLQKAQAERQRAEEEKAKIAESLEAGGPGLGPSVMAAQAKLISRLLDLAQQVNELQGDDKREERLAVSQRVEEELIELEASMADAQAGSAVSKQQAGLIALVRSALRSDREEEPEDGEDWSEEGLRKKHGVVTYASEAYWKEAYSHGNYGETFEWYGSWEQPDLNGRSLREIVRPHIPADPRILVVGCGNSNMSAHLHGDGFSSITSVDVSETVIEQMRERHRGLEGMEWHAMDASKMTFGAGAFDLAVEKGLFDALFAGTGERVQPVLTEVERVLKPGAKLVSVSFDGNRIDRLFKRGEVGAGSERLGACRVAGELSYRKVGSSSAAHAADDTKTIFVYVCERSASP